MAKSKSKTKSKSKPKRPASPIRKTAKPPKPPSEFGRKLVRLMMGLLVVAVIAGGFYFAGRFMEQRVGDRRNSVPVPYHIEFLSETQRQPGIGVPAWMPNYTCQMISRSVMEFPEKVNFQSSTLCRNIANKLMLNPWILRIEKVWRERRGAKGVVYVKAVYRCPLVKVIRGTQEIYVADDGMVLPESEVPKWVAKVAGRLRYYVHPSEVPTGFTRLQNFFIAVQGVQTPPSQPGQTWLAEDLHAGIRLAKLLCWKPDPTDENPDNCKLRSYYRQLSLIDVSNYARRIDANGAELVFYAQEARTRPTKILFGRFPHPDGGDYVIAPKEKMAQLDGIAGKFDGQIAGTYQQIDLRYDPPRKKDQ